MASYGLSINPAGSGSVQVSVNGEIVPLPEKGIVHTGSESTVVLTAVSEEGYLFHSWNYSLDGINRTSDNPVLTLKHPYGGSVHLNFIENAETIEFREFVQAEKVREEADKIAAYRVKFMKLK